MHKATNEDVAGNKTCEVLYVLNESDAKNDENDWKNDYNNVA